MYYEICESTARTAHELGHHHGYVKNSATKSYRASVDEIVKIAEQQKALVKQSHHDRIDQLVDRYAKKLADWTNR